MNQSEEFVNKVLESISEGLVVVNREFKIVIANKAYCEQVKVLIDDIIGQPCYRISHHADRPCYENNEKCAVKEAYDTGEPAISVHKHYDKYGAPIFVETRAYPIKDSSGKTNSVVETITNITEKVNLENQLRQSQKLEAIGKLAGGIAHDFNNILTTIMGLTDITLNSSATPKESKLHEDLEGIKKAVKQAASLTHQLLAFSRKQPLQMQTTDINNLLTEMKKMLERIIGENIEVILTPDPELSYVQADAGQLQQIIMNLAVNARDAMPDGGKLTIKTENALLDEQHKQFSPDARKGKFIRILVEDTGKGMTQETMQHIFEPFFTTKESGKGTGLGLAVVYGIVKQHEGWINVTSKSGTGTTFTIYLPASIKMVEEKIKERPVTKNRHMNGKRILLVEDDESIRKFVSRVLTANGYNIFVAGDGKEALDIFDKENGNLDLLFCDVILPGENGIQLVNHILLRKPGIGILLTSGYVDKIVQMTAIRDKGFPFLEKPYSINDLLESVQNSLIRVGLG